MAESENQFSLTRVAYNVEGRKKQILSFTSRTRFFGGVLLLPVLIQRIRDLGQPCPVFDQLQQLQRGKEFHAVRRRIAQRIEQDYENRAAEKVETVA